MAIFWIIIAVIIIYFIIRRRRKSSVNLGRNKSAILPTLNKETIPYCQRKRTKTGLYKALGTDSEPERGHFGVDRNIHQVSLSENAKTVYKYLSRIADANGYCFPFYKTIAKRCSISSSSVSKAILELESIGLLVRKRRVSRRGGSSNLYQIKKVNSLTPINTF